MQNHTPVFNRFLFLFISFPLGLIFFVLTVVGLSLSTSLLIIWIGLPLLLLTLFLIRGMAALERSMLASLTGVVIWTKSPPTRSGGKTRFMAILRDPDTWKSALYMLLKLPLGIVSFTICLTLPIIATSLTVMPLVYIVLTSIVGNTDAHIAQIFFSDSYTFIPITGVFNLIDFAKCLACAALGVLAWIGIAKVIHGMTALWEGVARALLGSEETMKGPTPAEPYDLHYTGLQAQEMRG
ncbi:putative sensor protein [Thermosporothrix hazakensis]|jgi:hypothetical protein|uniref:Putative sensor protein n=1 Tax=Thermosporothrix hazakensis TaxID=644383 RepID=A0A326U205_THEHA|nr:sensor domain-containing protein [Thermosporothrix hazakensis]PZW24644.1 putative sensor protein [Thermosporothrix hazakensis]GCE48407.1 hypothetical protein KTH_32760 [Thermosporothrix hazakensis]